MEVYEMENFLRNLPACFQLEVCGSGCRLVRCNAESCCIFIDAFKSSKGKVVFLNSPGRTIKVLNLQEYSMLRRDLTSKQIFIKVSACEETKTSFMNKKTVLQNYIVAIDGRNPVTRWELERGLDKTISSVAGESYTVHIDLREALQQWAGNTFCIYVDGRDVKPVWTNTHFTIKYQSDALCDFPHWLGFSKRRFQLSYRDG